MTDPNIILAGRPYDFAGSFGRGNALASAVLAAKRDAELAQLYRTQGPGIAAGDPGALNALAAFDPNASLGVQQNRLGMDATRQEMAFSAEKMEMLREQGRMAAQEALKAEGAAAKAAQAAQEAQLLKGLAPLYQTGDRAGFEAFAAQNGIPVTWENYLPAAAMAEGVMDVVNAFNPPEAPAPLTDIAKMRADLAAGRMTQADFDLAMAGKAPRGTSISVGPDGTVQFNEGAGVGQLPAGQNPANTGTPRDPGKLATKLSEADSATIAAERDKALNASTLESIAGQMDVLAPQLGYTGPGGKIYGALDDVTGVLPGDSGARGAFRSLSTEAQLTFTEKTKGAITDREMANFQMAVPSLTQTPEGNATISEVLRAGAKRVQSRAQFMEAYAAKVGSLEGAQAAWQKFMDANPVIVADKSGNVRAGADGDWSAYLPGAGVGSDFTQMPLEELLRQDTSNMDLETLRKFNAAMDEAGL